MALLLDPAARARQHVLISVDDHLIEPPDVFDGRLPATLADQAPRIVEADDGRQLWRYKDANTRTLGAQSVSRLGLILNVWRQPAKAASRAP